jgi:hypothetical protein
MPTLSRLLARHDAVTLGGTNRLASHPRLYLAVARRRYGDRVLGPGTDIVIEGFPRSANTFAVTAFQMAQPEPVTVAHHLHAVAHVARAVELGVPVILLVRRPDDAVASVLARKPSLGPGDVAAAYAAFHEGVLRHLDGCVVAEFGDVTTDFGTVVARVNARFGTSFAEFEHTEENERRCFELIEGENRRRAAGAVVEATVARPSSERARSKSETRAEIDRALTPALRERVDRAYRAVVDRSAKR